MLARIRKSLENREEGFTLIELLVVMVIIGILAAIAIPSFLAQRDKGYQSAEKSDLKTVSIAEQSYATDNNGAFVTDVVPGGSATGLLPQGAKVTNGDVVTATAFASVAGGIVDSYCLSTNYSSKTPAVWYLSSVDDTPTKNKPTGCP
jgi:type IV pilus assembly protein PilA